MKVTSPQPTSETLLGSLASAEPSIARGESGVKKNRSTKSDKTAAQKAVDALYEADKTRGEDAASLAALRKKVLDKTWKKEYDVEERNWAEKNGYTLLTGKDRIRISKESGRSKEIVSWIDTQEQYDFLREANVKQAIILNRYCLKKDIDFSSEDGKGHASNDERVRNNRSPKNYKSKVWYNEEKMKGEMQNEKLRKSNTKAFPNYGCEQRL